MREGTAVKVWTAEDWTLCRERCANSKEGGGCMVGEKIPPDKCAEHPRPPEECAKFKARADGETGRRCGAGRGDGSGAAHGSAA